MDSRRFDDWTRRRALRLSRRDAFRLAGVSGAAATLIPSSQRALAQSTCSLTLHAETAAGASAPAVFDGILQFTIGPDGSLAQATYTPASGAPQSVTGQATGRSFDALITLGPNQVLALSGAGDRPITQCQGAVGGIFSGPQPGDLGSWRADTAPGSAASAPAPSSGGAPAPPDSQSGGDSAASPACPSGQLFCGDLGCIDVSADPNNCGACENVCVDDTGFCLDGVCQCIPDNQPKGSSSTSCCSQRYVGPTGLCGCALLGEWCGSTGECCDSGALCVDGDNGFMECCLPPGSSCSSDADCCFSGPGFTPQTACSGGICTNKS